MIGLRENREDSRLLNMVALFEKHKLLLESDLEDVLLPPYLLLLLSLFLSLSPFLPRPQSRSSLHTSIP